MKLATYTNGHPDGVLMVVSSDLSRAVGAAGIAPTMIDALERWAQVEPQLQALSTALNAGEAEGAAFDPSRCMAPLPRARQWLDSSAFLHHGRLMAKAFGIDMGPEFDTVPCVYQGASDDFKGPHDPVPFVTEDHWIDMEGEFGVILDEVPMNVAEENALDYVRLVVQLNDWSLRAIAPREMKTGFGWVQAKPSTAFAPVAVTPDELGDGWQDGRVQARLHIEINGREVGRAHGRDMEWSFARLIAYCAGTRRLSAGTIVGTGTVANDDPAAGSSCLSELRVIEAMASGEPQTPFLSFGDRVRMEARLDDGRAPFGIMDQDVVKG